MPIPETLQAKFGQDIVNAAPLGPRLAICAFAIAFGPSAGAADAVQAWVTTADQSRLLAREPDLAFAAQAPLAIRIEVDPQFTHPFAPK